MARVHYKKLRSRDVARKGQECMRKLRSMTLQDSSTDDSVSDDFSASHNSTQNAEVIVDTLPETSAMLGKEFCNPPRKAPKKRLKFTDEEDACLFKGINKYWNWSMETDASRSGFKFQPLSYITHTHKKSNSSTFD